MEDLVDVDDTVLVETDDLFVLEDCLLLEAFESVVVSPFDSHDRFNFVLNDLILLDDEAEDTELLASESTRCGQRSVVVDTSMINSLCFEWYSSLFPARIDGIVEVEQEKGQAETREKYEDHWGRGITNRYIERTARSGPR